MAHLFGSRLCVLDLDLRQPYLAQKREQNLASEPAGYDIV